VDRASGYKTNSILCLPIKGAGKTVGVIQLINKLGGPFNDDDEEMMSTFLDLAGPILSASNLVSKRSGTNEGSNELTGKSEGVRISPRTSGPSMKGFAEEEEEEEE
jgi:adenylate cyclase